MQRSSHNPILTRADIPAVNDLIRDVSSVFNPGAVRFKGRTFLALRVQTRGRETVLMPAWSTDGEHFEVLPEQIVIEGLERLEQRIHHVYDPRLTEIEGVVYMVFAADTDSGCMLGIACSTDCRRWRLAGFGHDENTRNGVLLPTHRGGRYLRLERPNCTPLAGAVAGGSEIILAESLDLIDWRPLGTVMSGRPHYWDELIGSGPPPVRTREGWLHVYHGIATHFAAANIYQAGAVLLDLNNPLKVIARGRNNILEPREMYELTGQVPGVVFPSGMVVDEYDSEGFAKPDSRVVVYYGAADTVVGAAFTTISDLLTACHRQ